jgi:hypothetical protein
MSSGKGRVSGAIELIFAIVIGVILMGSLYPVNQFMAIVGVVLATILGIKGFIDILRD